MNQDSNFNNKMIISIINQKHKIINEYHLNTWVWTDYSQSQREELATHVGHYKHWKQEKKIQDVSPWRMPPLGFCISPHPPNDIYSYVPHLLFNLIGFGLSEHLA